MEVKPTVYKGTNMKKTRGFQWKVLFIDTNIPLRPCNRTVIYILNNNPYGKKKTRQVI